MRLFIFKYIFQTKRDAFANRNRESASQRDNESANTTIRSEVKFVV